LAGIRTTGEPAVLEFSYHRYLEHVGIDEDYCHGYRCRKDFEQWYQVDPVSVQRSNLLKTGISEAEIVEMEQQIQQTISGSVANAHDSPYPPDDELFTDVCI
jgi:pyruvate dehydrogenase E1 component alpha subunit